MSFISHGWDPCRDGIQKRSSVLPQPWAKEHMWFWQRTKGLPLARVGVGGVYVTRSCQPQGVPGTWWLSAVTQHVSFCMCRTLCTLLCLFPQMLNSPAEHRISSIALALASKLGERIWLSSVWFYFGSAESSFLFLSSNKPNGKGHRILSYDLEFTTDG